MNATRSPALRLLLGAFVSLALGAGATATEATKKPVPAKAPAKPAAKPAAAPKAPAKPALSQAQMDAASWVQVGTFACFDKKSVTVKPDEANPGTFDVTVSGRKFDMTPEPTTTGAVRLEDKARGGVWLQLANKSMFMDQRQGQRLADDCISAEQRIVQEGLNIKPAENILEDKVPK